MGSGWDSGQGACEATAGCAGCVQLLPALPHASWQDTCCRQNALHMSPQLPALPAPQAGGQAAEDGDAGGSGSSGKGGSSSAGRGRSSFELLAVRLDLCVAILGMATVYYLLAFPLRWIFTEGLLLPKLDWQRLVQTKLEPVMLWLHAVLRVQSPRQDAIAAAGRHAADITSGKAMLLAIGALGFSYARFVDALIAFRAWPKRTQRMGIGPFILYGLFVFAPPSLFFAALFYHLFA